MILRFEVGNFLSIKERMTLDLRATADSEHRETHTVTAEKETVLRSVALYGPNGSGKSNVLTALAFMRGFVQNSSKETQQDEEIEVTPFRLSTETEGAPSFFEIELLFEGVRYRYGFEATRERVYSEWLFAATSAKEAELFTRDKDEITYNAERFKEGREFVSRTRANALFLSVNAQFAGEVSSRVLRAILACRIVRGNNRPDRLLIAYTARRLQDEVFRVQALQMLEAADLAIKGVRVENPPQREPIDTSENSEPPISVRIASVIKTLHAKYSAEKVSVGQIEFDLLRSESGGTIRFVGLLAPIVETLERGSVLVVDELDARMHPLMTRFLVGLFHGPANPAGAQLIFATHDVNLLSNRYFRRDQVWFTEKDRYEATHLYSLADYRVDGDKVRKDASFAKDYLMGKFGAVPFIGDFMIHPAEAKPDA
jgi:AAA15 family ATPase/GTPase